MRSPEKFMNDSVLDSLSSNSEGKTHRFELAPAQDTSLQINQNGK